MKISSTLRNILKAVINGSLMLQLHLDKHFIKVIVCMGMCLLTIWISLLIDNTMMKVKRNNDTLKEQQKELSRKAYQRRELTRRSTIELRLENMGSEIRKPEKPAKELK